MSPLVFADDVISESDAEVHLGDVAGHSEDVSDIVNGHSDIVDVEATAHSLV
jgi:hypothetical protein